jgi:subtilisin family serine protease
MREASLRTPWAARTRLYSAPDSVLVKIALGEEPDEIPAAADVREGVLESATRTRIRPVDRVLNHFAERVRITRIYSAAASVSLRGRRHAGFDDLEIVIGLSRTFRIDCSGLVPVDDLVDSLREVGVVEEAYRHYLCTVPFQKVEPAPATILHDVDSWQSRRQIFAQQALAYEVGDPSILIGVVDSGVVQSHLEFEGKLRPGLDTVQLTSGQLSTRLELVGDTQTADQDPEDNVGHGTACAGIIAARGYAMPPGLAGDCRVLPVRVLGGARFAGKRELAGIGSIADIDRGMKYCIDLGARVINMSFGTPEAELDAYDPLPHSDVVRYGVARGAIMIAASGNEGGTQRFSPACLDEVIAVGAVGPDNHPAPFSTGGDHVDITAPGVRVLSAGLGGYSLVTGTSFAAPFVTAAVALLVSHAATHAFPLDGEMAKRILCESASPFDDPAISGHGAGVLNVWGALCRLDELIERENEASLSSTFSHLEQQTFDGRQASAGTLH